MNSCMARAYTTSLPTVPVAPAASKGPTCPSTKAAAAAASCRHRTVSCRATGGGGRGDDGLIWLPRRDVLTGLGGAAAGLVGYYPSLVSAALGAEPVEQYRRVDKVNDELVQCTDPPNNGFPCPQPSPAAVPIVDFKPPASGTVKRVRRPVHLLDEEYQQKYKEAVGKMKALPPSNPLSFAAQAAVHEAYCDGHYRYGGPAPEKNRPFDVHFSWLFAPWHRMYIFFYERALGKLIGDDTFALPYWNWDSPAGMVIPPLFKDFSYANPLHDCNREQSRLDALVDLHFHKKSDAKDRTESVIPFNRPK